MQGLSFELFEIKLHIYYIYTQKQNIKQVIEAKVFRIFNETVNEETVKGVVLIFFCVFKKDREFQMLDDNEKAKFY